jgi:SAM-dependent methyltransferase
MPDRSSQTAAATGFSPTAVRLRWNPEADPAENDPNPVTTMRTATLTCFFALSLLVAPSVGALQVRVPYVPSPAEVVDRMLTVAAITKDDVVYDLGSGDGRIPIAAARKYGARGVGLDINPDRITESRANAKAAGVEQLVEFREQDVMTADFSEATVVTLYLLASANAQLRPIITKQVRPGTRIVSHAFSMGATWPADTVDHFKTATGDEITIYLWKFDGKFRP